MSYKSLSKLNYIIPKVLRKILNPPAVRNSRLDKTSRCDIGSVVSDSTMGKYSYIGEHTVLSKVEVGNFTSISGYCAIGGGSHPLDWVSTSSAFNNTGGIIKTKLANNSYDAYKQTIIGNDVWIGAHTLIKGGVKISDGAVIGMGSVVTKDVGPYEIWAGNPARLIRKRFDDETIEKLISVKWWLWDDEKIKTYGNHFSDVNEFLNNCQRS